MPIPWLRLIDAVLGINDLVLRVGTRTRGGRGLSQALAPSSGGGIEARLAGVVVGALKEAFDRDHQRHEFERQQMEAEQRRAERVMKLELLRQAGEREIGRMRLVAGLALASWLGTLAVTSRLLGGVGGRIALGLGWALLFWGMAQAFTEQGRISRILSSVDVGPLADTTRGDDLRAGTPQWLVVSGLGVVALGVLIS